MHIFILAHLPHRKLNIRLSCILSTFEVDEKNVCGAYIATENPKQTFIKPEEALAGGRTDSESEFFLSSWLGPGWVWGK